MSETAATERRPYRALVVTLLCTYLPYAWLPLWWSEHARELVRALPLMPGLFPSILLKQSAPGLAVAVSWGLPVVIVGGFTLLGVRSGRRLCIGSAVLLLVSFANALGIHAGMGI